MSLTITLQRATAPQFVFAFSKLMDEPMPVKDRFVLAQCWQVITKELTAYEQCKDSLVRRFGKPEVEILRKRLAVIQADKATTPEDQKANEQLVEALANRIKVLQQGNVDSWLVETEHKKAFDKDLAALLDQRIELPLKHRIPVSAESKLSVVEIEALMDLVSPPA